MPAQRRAANRLFGLSGLSDGKAPLPERIKWFSKAGEWDSKIKWSACKQIHRSKEAVIQLSKKSIPVLLCCLMALVLFACGSEQQTAPQSLGMSSDVQSEHETTAPESELDTDLYDNLKVIPFDKIQNFFQTYLK